MLSIVMWVSVHGISRKHSLTSKFFCACCLARLRPLLAALLWYELPVLWMHLTFSHNWGKCIAVMLQASHHYGNSRAIWDHSVTCHPAEMTFPPLPQPITRFSDPRGMQGWVELVDLVTYQGGIPAQRRSPIPVLNGLNVKQVRSYDERRYHSAKPP